MINAEWTGMNKPVFVFGKKVIEYLVRVGGGVQMILLAFLFLPTLWRNRKEVYRQMMLCGIKSFGVTSVVALFTGMILALQAGLILKAYGQEMRVGFLVAQTMFREMGPFMTALILAASVGSGMAGACGAGSDVDQSGAFSGGAASARHDGDVPGADDVHRPDRHSRRRAGRLHAARSRLDHVFRQCAFHAL